MTPKTLLIGGFHTLVATRAELAARMVEDCAAARRVRGTAPKLVFSSNGQGISLASRSPEFARVMAQADLIHADGMPVVTASRFLTGTRLPERIATTDFFHDAAQAACTHGLRFFMLGGSEALNRSVCDITRRLYPSLCIAGGHHGYFPEEKTEEVCRLVVESGTDVLWVGLGKPMQEYWSVANRDRLMGIGWIKTCGGLYAHLTGHERRAPRWMQACSLEWLYRTLQDPKRLGRRYLMTSPHAVYRILRDSG